MKISDFKLAEHFIKAVSRKLKFPFVDVPITFDEGERFQPTADFTDGKLVVSGCHSLGQTILAIVGTYLNKISAITGSNVSISDQEQINFQKMIMAMSRGFLYSEGQLPEAVSEKGLRTHLRNFPFVWVLLRDIITPAYQSKLSDMEVIMGRSAQVDAARLLQAGDIKGIAPEELPIIFVNTEVESNTIRSAYLLVEAMRAMDIDVQKGVSDLLGCPDLKKKVYGYVKMAFVVEKEVDDFLLTLAAIGGFQDPVSLINKRESAVWYKAAQSGGGPGGSGSPGGSAFGTSILPTSWFTPVLMEGMMDWARGPDYTVTKMLQPQIDELWERVAEEKKRRGKDDMSLEDLLRVKSEGMRVTPKQTLQGLLAQERIW